MKKLMLLFPLVLVLPSISSAEGNKDDIRRVIRNHMSEVKSCYSELLTKKDVVGDRSGKVVVAWDFNDQGKVIQASIKEDATTLKNADLHKCILEKVKTWEFPKPPAGQSVSIAAYPFMFNVSDKKK